MKPLISFDLDQTLVDTVQSHLISYIEVFKKNNLKIPSKERLRRLIDGRHGKRVIYNLYPSISKEKAEKLRLERKPILAKYSKLMKPIPGAKKALNSLKKNHKLALITNAAKNEVDLFLKKSRINPKIFDLILIGNKMKHPKPFPDSIIRAEHLLHVKSDIHVGDSVYDVLAAKRAGALSIAVLTGQATRKDLSKHKPNYILNSVAELPKLLKRISVN